MPHTDDHLPDGLELPDTPNNGDNGDNGFELPVDLGTGAFAVVGAPYGKIFDVKIKPEQSDLETELLARETPPPPEGIFAVVDHSVSNLFSGMRKLEEVPFIGFIFQFMIEVSFRFGALLVGVFNIAMFIPRILVKGIPVIGDGDFSEKLRKAKSDVIEVLELESEGIFVFATIMLGVLLAILSVFIFKVSPDAFGILSNVIAFGSEQLKNLSGRLGG